MRYEDFVRSFYGVMVGEVREADPELREALSAYYSEAGLFSPWKRRYFFYHYGDSVGRALGFLLGRHLDRVSKPVILDLGCGLGSQSLMLAALGARVIAFDRDGAALAMLQRRKAHYEETLKWTMEIRCVQGSAPEFDFCSLGRLDGVFSLFAFNMMQPSRLVLDRVCEVLEPQGRLAIQDGNRDSWLAGLLGRRREVLGGKALAHELRLRQMRICFHRPTGCVPPQLCFVLPDPWIGWLDRRLCVSWRLGISQQVLAEKV